MSKFERPSAAEDALRGVQAKAWAPPARDAMLAQVYLRANTKEDHMSVFDRLFAARPLVAKLGIAAALLALLVVAAIMLPRPGYSPALAATEGVVLNYDLSSFAGSEDAAKAKFHAIEDAVKANLPDGVQLLTANVKQEIRKEKRIVKHDGVEQGTPTETETKQVNGIIVLSSADDDQVAKLNAAVSKAVPDVAAPQVEDATWFRENGGSLDGGIDITLGLNGDQHVFNFPKGTSADEIKRQIKQWVEEKHPGMDFNVDVTKTGDGAQNQQIEVRIEGKEDEQK